MLRSSRLAAVILSGCALAACGKSRDTAQAPGSAPPASQPQPTPATAAIAAARRQLSIADIFPPGPGREQVMDTCGTCHPVACSARGQRTAQQWDRIQESHKDRLTSVSSENMTALYSYLKANFNDTKPEPQIPAEFLQQGCTPF